MVGEPGLGLLTAGAGVGKTAAMRHLCSQLPPLLQSPLLRRLHERYRFGNAVQRLNVEHVRRLVVPVAPTREAVALAALVKQRMALTQGVRALDGAHIASLERAFLAKAFSGELVLPETPDASWT